MVARITTSGEEAVRIRPRRFNMVCSMRILMALTCLLSGSVYDAILPRPDVRTVDWAEEHVSTPPGSEIKGKVRFDLFPYMRQVLDCCDDPQYERVTVQAASRTGKTVAGQCFLAKIAATNPHPMCLADADDASVQRVIKRTWLLFEGTAGLAEKCPPRKGQSAKQMQLVDCLIHGAWSGSPSAAADFASYATVKNEVDKWSRRKSDEADFAYLIDERAKGFPGATILEISTPTVQGESHIEAERQKGDNRQFYVPCPHCRHYQTLRSGDGQSRGGLRWEKGPDGHSDPAIAFETAWYECEACGKAIQDEHRYAMINAGRWLCEGQTIDRAGRVRGTPKRAGRHASFGPLGTHYSLLPTITWGRIAREYVEAKQDPTGRKWRHFLNSWEGETWDPAPRQVEPHELADRLGVDDPPRLCPEWSRFLTLAADVGRTGDELIFYWWACAWGLGGRGQLVDYGVVDGEEKWKEFVRSCQYPHTDGGGPLRPARVGIDAGSSHANRVYTICEELDAWPLKGSARSDFPEAYQLGFRRADVPKRLLQAKQRAGRGDLLIVNTQRSQQMVEDFTSGLVGPEDPAWFSIPREAFDDPDFAEQLLGDYPVEDFLHGRLVVTWPKRGPNEWRDCWRYAWALAQLYTRQGRMWNRLTPRKGHVGGGSSAPTRQSPKLTTPDGRPYFVLDR